MEINNKTAALVHMREVEMSENKWDKVLTRASYIGGLLTNHLDLVAFLWKKFIMESTLI